jgi:nucleotide-binding universal stress UspA family protein
MKILIAVDNSKGAKACVDTCLRTFSGSSPQTVTLLHVQQYGGGGTLVHDRISDPELETLKEGLKDMGRLDGMQKASQEILDGHKAALQKGGLKEVKTIIRSGHVAEEILKGAKEEGANMIIIGNTRGMLDRLMMGDVTKEVIGRAEVPVLLAK